MRALALLLLLAPPAAAQQALDAEGFEALVEGRTLTYAAEGGEPYGIERYRPGRRVTWAWAGDDECLPGTWYEGGTTEDPAICFLYEGDPVPQCWRIFQDGEGLRAVFLGEGGGAVLYELAEAPGGLVCGGVGV